MTVESMRWSLYERSKKLPIPPSGVLPSQWNTSFGRAVNSLASESRSLLHIEKRWLTSLEECVAHYPGKTLSAAIRCQRQELLPALLEWTREEHGASPHYNAAQNEEYFVRRIPQERVRWVRAEWARIESLIRPVFARSGSDDLFLLLAKGKSLFQGMELASPRSFTKMVQRCCASNMLPGAVADEVRKFTGEFLSATTAGSLHLKSLVHEFANVPSQGRCSLREDTLKALHRLRKSFIEAMPGFESAARDSMFVRGPKYSDALHKLFDQTVFQKFSFVRLVA